MAAWLAQLEYDLCLPTIRFLVQFPALMRFGYFCDVLYHQTLSNGGMVGAIGIRSPPSDHKVKVPGSISEFAQVWAFVWPSFPQKLSQLSILPRSVIEYQLLLRANLQCISVTSRRSHWRPLDTRTSTRFQGAHTFSKKLIVERTTFALPLDNEFAWKSAPSLEILYTYSDLKVFK